MSIDAEYIAGDRVHERYRLLGRIATGQAGEVWRAVDELLDRTVAVKLLRPEYACDVGFVERFRVEARLAGRLSHPGVVAVYDFGEGQAPMGSPWLVMELVPGESLAAILSRDGALDPDRALDLIAQAAEAVQAAHAEGVVHRDIKPANLLVTGRDRVKVTDFGIARAIGSVSLTATGQVLGTAHYLSPEQARGEPATPASDVYSLGVVLYECLAGRRPFSGPSPVAVARAQIRSAPAPLPLSVPAEMRSLVDRVLDKNPQHRPGTAGDLAAEIRALAAAPVAPVAPPVTDSPGSEPLAESPTTTIKTRRVAHAARSGRPRSGRRRAHSHRDTRRRPPKFTMAALGVLAALVAFGGISAFRSSDPPRPDAVLPSSGPTISQEPTLPADRKVQVDPAEFLGRPYDEVATTLRSMGFTVKASRVQASGQPGTVIALAPSGVLPYGSALTVDVVSSAPTPTAASTPTVDTSQPSVTQDGKDHGDRGKGKGRG